MTGASRAARSVPHYGFVTAIMDRTFGTEWPDWLELHTKIMDGRPLSSLREKGSLGQKAPR